MVKSFGFDDEMIETVKDYLTDLHLQFSLKTLSVYMIVGFVWCLVWLSTSNKCKSCFDAVS